MTVDMQEVEHKIHLVFMVTQYSYGGQDSSVGMATRYGLDGPGIESRWGRDFPPPSRPAQPASCTMGTGSFLGVKRPGRGADTPLPSSVPRP